MGVYRPRSSQLCFPRIVAASLPLSIHFFYCGPHDGIPVAMKFKVHYSCVWVFTNTGDAHIPLYLALNQSRLSQ